MHPGRMALESSKVQDQNDSGAEFCLVRQGITGFQWTVKNTSSVGWGIFVQMVCQCFFRSSGCWAFWHSFERLLRSCTLSICLRDQSRVWLGESQQPFAAALVLVLPSPRVLRVNRSLDFQISENSLITLRSLHWPPTLQTFRAKTISPCSRCFKSYYKSLPIYLQFVKDCKEFTNQKLRADPCHTALQSPPRRSFSYPGWVRHSLEGGHICEESCTTSHFLKLPWPTKLLCK